MVGFHFFKNLSIRTHLIMGVTFVHALLMALLSFDSYSNQKHFLIQQNIEEGLRLSHSIATLSVNSVLTKDFAGLQEVLTTQKQILDVDYIAVTDQTGQVLGQTTGAENWIEKPGDIDPQASGPKVVREDKNTLVVSCPVLVNSTKIGWVEMQLNRVKLRQASANLLRNGIIFSILAICAGAVMAMFLAQFLTRQLDSLRESIASMSKGETDVFADDSAGNEIGKIAGQFNLMTQKIAELQTAKVTVAKFAALGEMAAGIAHEINNPLGVILGKTALLKRKIKSGQLTNDQMFSEIEKIENTTFRISKIIIGLKSFSRDATQEEATEVLFQKILSESLDMTSELVEKLGFKIQTNTPADLMVYCCHIQISQVLLNLISNAMDASLHLNEKWIAIEAKKDGEFVKITVTDSGNGIDESIQEKMMQPFFTTKDIGKGTGLGLSISKGIVEKHGGRFYYNNKSKNTQFVIELPSKKIQANSLKAS